MQIQRWLIRNEIGKDLRVGPIETEHASLLKSWMDSSLITQNILRNFAISIDDEHNWIQSAFDSENRLLIGVFVEEELIGSWTLNLDSWETGSIIGSPEHRGKGYGTLVHTFRTWYAFEQLNLPMLRSCVFWDDLDEKYRNYASFKALSKVGYVDVGVERARRFMDGKWRSVKSLECFNPTHWAGNQPSDILQSIEIVKNTVDKGYEIIERISKEDEPPAKSMGLLQ